MAGRPRLQGIISYSIPSVPWTSCYLPTRWECSCELHWNTPAWLVYQPSLTRLKSWHHGLSGVNHATWFGTWGLVDDASIIST